MRISAALAATLAVAAFNSAGAAASTSTTSLSVSSTSLTAGETVTLTATVMTSSGTTPGTVTFSANSSSISGCGSVTVTASQATCTTSFSQPGPYGLQAYYSGDGMFNSWSTSPQVNITVAGLTPTVTLTSSSSFPTTGLTFVLTSTLSGTSGDGTPFVGSVEFLDNGAPVGGCASQPAGEAAPGQPPFLARCQLSFSAPGSHSFVARYLGDSHWAAASSAPLLLTVRPAGGAIQSCPGQDQVFTGVHLAAARGALLCLINNIRASYGLGPLTESSALDAHAEAHPGQDWAPPGARSGSKLFDGYGEDTPYAVVAAWMGSRETCFDLLSPRDEAGFGVADRPVILAPPQHGQPAFGVAPAWTALVFATAQGSPSNSSAAGACPHPLPVDAAGQGRLRSAHHSVTDLLVALAAHRGGSLVLDLIGQVDSPFAARLTVTAPGGAERTVRIHGSRRGKSRILRVRFGAAALRTATRGSIVRVLVSETAPGRSLYLFELRL